jgi:hypothetical protein
LIESKSQILAKDISRKGAKAAKFEEERILFAFLASWRDKAFCDRFSR